MAENALPGVKLWLDGCEERDSILHPGAVNFNMQVAGTAATREIFEKVKAKFNDGFEVHTVEDLKGQMIKVLKEDNATYEHRIRNLEMQLMNERKAHLQTKEELKNARSTFDFLKSKASDR